MDPYKLKMTWHYIKDIVAKTFKISIHYSPIFALYGLLWWFGFFYRTKYSWRITSFALRKKTKWLDSYFENKYGDIIKKYRYFNLDQQKKSDNIIWFFWGQGEDAMPQLVRACYRQLRKHNSNIRLITNDNLNEYISLNPLIQKKVELGIIGYANYSDIIRNTLLKTYGGLWLDSTVWVSGNICFDKLNGMSLYTANSKELINSKSVRFWSSYQWNWSSWCLWANSPNNIFYSFVSDMLCGIALRENCWPDYVIQDYLFYYACTHFQTVRQQFDRMFIHNPNKDELALYMNKAFDFNQYLNITKDECFFKLRYRKKWALYTIDGKETYYSRILKDTI